MDKVYDNLYVGDVNDADNHKNREKNNINYILNLSKAGTDKDSTPSQKTINNLHYHHIPLDDGGENSDFLIEQAIQTGQKLHEKAMEDDTALLVHCSVGASRSVAISAALMGLQNGRRVQENVHRIKQVRPIANPEPALQSQVNRITAEIYND